MTIADIAMFEMNFVANQSHKLPTNEHEKFLSWKIQMICQAVFNIVIVCAFSVFILALLSIKTAEEPFHSLKDFVVKRTHVICNEPRLVTMRYFANTSDALEVWPQFEGILNTKSCTELFIARSDEQICTMENYAIVLPVYQFRE